MSKEVSLERRMWNTKPAFGYIVLVERVRLFGILISKKEHMVWFEDSMGVGH